MALGLWLGKCEGYEQGSLAHPRRWEDRRAEGQWTVEAQLKRFPRDSFRNWARDHSFAILAKNVANSS